MTQSFLILNGEMVERDKATVTADDRGLLLGDGLFETIRAYHGRPFRLDDHLDRLYRSCAEFNLLLPWEHDDLGEMTQRLIQKNRVESARVRITVTRGPHTGGMGLGPAQAPTLLISAESIPDGIPGKAARGLKLVTADVRFSENNPVFKHKTLNRLPHLSARAQAEAAGADEAMILDERGNVACCSTGNLFVAQYGQLFTPPLTGPILPGVTRAMVLRLAAEESIPIRENYFSPLMLSGAEEAFMTNSIQEIVPVVSVNHRPVGSGKPGPLSARLLAGYRELTEE